jgi:hypothetical protein
VKGFDHFNALAAIAAICLAAAPLRAQQSPAPKPQPTTYLDQAGQLLGSVPTNVQHDASKSFDDLKKHFDELNKQYRTQRDTIGPPLTRIDPNQDVPSWRNAFADVERDLTALIGGGSTLAQSQVVGAQTAAAQPVGTTAAGSAAAIGLTGSTPVAPTDAGAVMPGTQTAPTVTTTPSGTVVNNQGAAVPPAVAANPDAANVANAAAAGAPNVQAVVSQPAGAPPVAGASADALGMMAATKVSVIGVKDLDPQVRAQLEQFRLQLELFYTTTM